MSEPRLSIIIPFYNVEKYIAQCLDSVYSQDIPEDEYEVICVDDCSPDGSLGIVQRYAYVHPNLTLVRNERNRKLGGARNAGLDVARGTYVWFIDSDDFIENNILGELLRTTENEDLDVLHFNYEWFPDHDHKDNHRTGSTEIMSGKEMFFDSRFIWFHDLVTAWRKLYRKDFLIENSIKFAEDVMFEDNDYAFLVFANAQRAKHISLHAYNYRSNPESITRKVCSSEHIAYWIGLCSRLYNIRNAFVQSGKDPRFTGTLDTFIKYQLGHLLREYAALPEDERHLVRSEISHIPNSSVKDYLTLKQNIKIRLGLI